MIGLDLRQGAAHVAGDGRDRFSPGMRCARINVKWIGCVGLCVFDRDRIIAMLHPAELLGPGDRFSIDP